MGEPILTEQKNATGRPAITDEQYAIWLKDLKPLLEMASSLRGACTKTGLLDKYNSCILEKYNLNDWFSKKVDAYRESFGESINEGLAREALRIVEKTRKGELLTKPEIDVLKHMSEKHRSCQPFFVTRQEVAQVEPNRVSQILDGLEQTDYEDLGQIVSNELERAKTQTTLSPALSNLGQA